jgi:hypothetical protein
VTLFGVPDVDRRAMTAATTAAIYGFDVAPDDRAEVR